MIQCNDRIQESIGQLCKQNNLSKSDNSLSNPVQEKIIDDLTCTSDKSDLDQQSAINQLQQETQEEHQLSLRLLSSPTKQTLEKIQVSTI